MHIFKIVILMGFIGFIIGVTSQIYQGINLSSTWEILREIFFMTLYGIIGGLFVGALVIIDSKRRTRSKFLQIYK